MLFRNICSPVSTFRPPDCPRCLAAQTIKGNNVYAIYAAPKTDGAEALVLSASWLSRAVDERAQPVVNTRGIAIVLALANYLKSAYSGFELRRRSLRLCPSCGPDAESSYWSKDIIFLISDGYADGAVAWLDAYHGYGQKSEFTGQIDTSCDFPCLSICMRRLALNLLAVEHRTNMGRTQYRLSVSFVLTRWLVLR